MAIGKTNAVTTNVPSTSQSINTIAGFPLINLANFNAHDIQLFITKMRQVLVNVTNTGAKLYKLSVIMGTESATTTYEETTAENFPIHTISELDEDSDNDWSNHRVILGMDKSVYSLVMQQLPSMNIMILGNLYPTWKIETENHVINIYVDNLLGSEKENEGTNDFSVIINDGSDITNIEYLTLKPVPYMSIVEID